MEVMKLKEPGKPLYISVQRNKVAYNAETEQQNRDFFITYPAGADLQSVPCIKH